MRRAQRPRRKDHDSDSESEYRVRARGCGVHAGAQNGWLVSHDDNPILSLATAAIVVYRKAIKGDYPDSDALDYIARMIAVRAPIFACSSERCSDLRLLTPDEVFEGQFEDGGTQI